MVAGNEFIGTGVTSIACWQGVVEGDAGHGIEKEWKVAGDAADVEECRDGANGFGLVGGSVGGTGVVLGTSTKGYL